MASTLAIVIGAGPAGLAAALRAADEGFDKVIVLEKRVYVRENELPEVLAPASPVIHHGSVENFRNVFERNNVLQISYWALQQLDLWGIRRDDPYLSMHRVAAVHISDMYHPPNVKPYGDVLENAVKNSVECIHSKVILDSQVEDVQSLNDVTPERIKADNLPYEVCGVPIQCLQRALYHAACRLYPHKIQFHYGVTDVQITERNEVPAFTVAAILDGGREPTSWAPEIIVVAEGSRRHLVKRELGLDPVAVSKPQLFMYGILTPEASAVIGSNIFFNRVWDPKVSRSDGNCFAKQSIIGRPGPPGQAVVFVQCDGRSGEAQNTIFQDMQTQMRDAFPMLANVDLRLDPSIPPQRFSVQETHVPHHVLNNLAIIGDAARTGHFGSAVGVIHSLVSDGNAIGPVYQAMVLKAKGGGTQAEVDQANVLCEARLHEIARIFHQQDLPFFYEIVDPMYASKKCSSAT